MIPIFLFSVHPFSKNDSTIFILFLVTNMPFLSAAMDLARAFPGRRVRSTFSELQSLECPGPGDIAGCCCPPEAPLIVILGLVYGYQMMFTMQ